MSSSAPQSSSRLAVEQRVPRACDRGGPPPDTVRAQECRNNGLIPGVDAQEPVSDDEFESFGAMDVRTVKRLPASRCEPDHSETNMSSIWFLSIRQHEDSLHRLRRRSPSGRVAAAGRHLGDSARRLAGTMGSPSPVAAIRSIVPFASTPVGWNSRRWRMAAPVWTGRAAISEIFTRPECPARVRANHERFNTRDTGH